jgi:hypothetical protein
MSVTSELRRRVRAERSLPRYEPCLPRPTKQPPAGRGWIQVALDMNVKPRLTGSVAGPPDQLRLLCFVLQPLDVSRGQGLVCADRHQRRLVLNQFGVGALQ